MFPIAIWIKYIAMLVFGIIVLVFSIFCYKTHKTNISKANTLTTIIGISVILAVFAVISGVKLSNPDYETDVLEYTYQENDGVIFGSHYHFCDKNGNDYDLTMDSITRHQIFKDKQFEKGKDYTITYENNSKTIIGIAE